MERNKGEKDLERIFNLIPKLSLGIDGIEDLLLIKRGSGASGKVLPCYAWELDE